MQQVGAFNYAMQFTISGFDELENRDWRVIITRPDGTSFERLAPEDVTVVDIANKLMAVRIKEDDDFPVEGSYKLQVWDETDGSSLRSSVMDFAVLNSLEPPA